MKTLVPYLAMLVVLGCGSNGGTDPDTGTDAASDAAPDLAEDAAPDTGADGIDPTPSFPLNDTGQTSCHQDAGGSIACPSAGSAFHGQDAQYGPNAMDFRDNGDGTVTDLNTGLMWVQAHGEKMTFDEAVAGASTFSLAGYTDWRLPTIKELYSLIDFSGETGMSETDSVPYIDTDAFVFRYGDTSAGERMIDAQYISATEYVGTVMDGERAFFGVNFADGRIKGYGMTSPMGGDFTGFVKYVRLNPGYGANDLVDGGDGTVTDLATGLTWQQADSGSTLDWEDALAYCEGLELVHSDWRLPNAKELQSIVDYTRAPLVTSSAAIDPVFSVTEIESYFWASTSHLDGRPEDRGSFGVYVSFGRAMGYMEMPPGSGSYTLLDVHGAGAQRSDPKTGDPADWPHGNGPQGDVVKIFNYARCVRDAS